MRQIITAINCQNFDMGWNIWLRITVKTYHLRNQRRTSAVQPSTLHCRRFCHVKYNPLLICSKFQAHDSVTIQADFYPTWSAIQMTGFLMPRLIRLQFINSCARWCFVCFVVNIFSIVHTEPKLPGYCRGFMNQVVCSRTEFGVSGGQTLKLQLDEVDITKQLQFSSVSYFR